MSYNVAYKNKEAIAVEDSQITVRLVSVDNSREPAKQLRLLLDTGAFVTLIRKERAVSHGYKIIKERALNIRGFSEKGILCDLRIIPVAVFCGFRIRDVIVATPHDDGVRITEVLGMNILENFDFGFSLSKSEIYLSINRGFASQKPKYSCGSISIFREDEFEI